jgi:hypothetical protein
VTFYEMKPYDQDEPIQWVRCLLCGREVERHEWEAHWADCDIVPFEEI